MLGGINKSRVTYDSLSISQWVSGFATIIKDEQNTEDKQNMLQYLSEIMEDSHDFGWGSKRCPCGTSMQNGGRQTQLVRNK